jgi:hypothetical protein
MGQNKINIMSFLDEVTYNVKPGQEVPDTVKDEDVVNIGEKKKKRPDYADIDGDGDRDEPMAKAFKDKENVEEGAASKFLGALGIAAALLAIGNQNKSDSVLKAIDAKIEMADTPAEKAALKKLANQRLVWLDTGKGPGGDIKASDVGDVLKEITTRSNMKEVTIDINEFIQNKLDEGKSQEDVVKLTKALMKKLHDKGEVKVDGTKLVFKENHSEQDTQLALPEPPAKDFLGDDDKDYEGGMAKSQLYKMKSYADKLCNMVDDESQLEAWVQAKLTKASDYMSAVFHYLDYQNSKMGDE